MNCITIDSDLEEGEILDDSPSSPCISIKKDRELPRRYVLLQNKKIHKHKKRDCKNAIRYHAKKLSKLKKTPNKDIFKGHYKSCSRDKSHRFNNMHNRPLSEHSIKNGHSFSKNSLIAEINFSFKDTLKKNLYPEIQISSPKKNVHPETHISNPETFMSVIKPNTPSNDLSTLEFFESNKKCESLRKDASNLKENNEHYIEKPDDSSHFKESGNSNEIKDAAIVSHSQNDESEESEDEEELRRIALATCAKRKPVVENVNKNEDSSVSVPESSKNSVQMSPHVKTNIVADNYEIVDMEVDEESENSVEIIDNESLFVIDTRPSSKIEGNVENSELGSQHKKNDSDDDFEADILRAELIGSMFRKRDVLEKQLEVLNKNVIHPKQIPLTQEKNSVTYRKPNVKLSSKPIQSAKRHTFKQNGVNKPRKIKYNSGTLTPNNEVDMPPKFVITVNGESSSEESDESEEVSSVPENPVASIEALISDCRQKSDSNDKTNEVVNPVPKAVSCLSKAQQEEYNTLMKILAEKKKLPVSQATVQQNNVHSPFDDLKLLEEKLSKFKEALKKKKILMANISRDVNAKKQVYMKSKLRVQLLKEQYLAAEKVRRIKLDEWSKSCHNFDGVKKSVSSLESKIIQLQNLCSKLNSSIQGLNYNLTSLPSSNGQL